MLKLYLSTVIIWMIIIYCTCSIFGPKVKENGWVNNTNVKTGKLVTLFIVSAVPFLRVVSFATIIYMSVCTKEKFEKMAKRN